MKLLTAVKARTLIFFASTSMTAMREHRDDAVARQRMRSTLSSSG
jgi:hypothetical protein